MKRKGDMGRVRRAKEQIDALEKEFDMHIYETFRTREPARKRPPRNRLHDLRRSRNNRA